MKFVSWKPQKYYISESTDCKKNFLNQMMYPVLLNTVTKMWGVPAHLDGLETFTPKKYRRKFSLNYIQNQINILIFSIQLILLYFIA